MDITMWNELREEGKEGEDIAAAFLTARGYKVTDVSEIKQFQDKDIDFIAEKDDKVLNIEVKYDNKISCSGNICCESISNKETGKLGWTAITESDLVFIVCPNNRTIYVVKTAEVKEKYKDGYKKTRSQLENGTYFKQAELYLLPLTSVYYETYKY